MVPFSRLRRFDVVDDAGRRARLVDCAIDLLDGDYPPVTHIFLRVTDHGLQSLPGTAVRAVEARSSSIRVRDLHDARDVADADMADPALVLLGRDVLDSLVLDLENRRATRANDLVVQDRDGRLELRAADASVRALVRRLTFGRAGGDLHDDRLHDWKYVEFLRGDAQAVRNGAGYHLRITRLPAGEIAGLAAAVPYRHAAELLKLLPDPLAASTLALLAPDRQVQVLEELDVDESSRLLSIVAPDIATDLVGQLLPADILTILDRMPADRRDCVVELLRYPEDTIGGIMTNDVVSAVASWTVEQTRTRLRKRLQEPDFIFFVYVIADEETRRLRGVLRLRDLIVADDDALLEDLMNPYLVTLDPLEHAETAAYRILDSHLVALPVVGADLRLLGAVTVDAAISVVAPTAWRSQAPRIFS